MSMKKSFKKHLAFFLTLLMTLPPIVSVLPMASAEVYAAYVNLSWKVPGYALKTIQVEKGQKFYVGDYVNIYTNIASGTASIMNASYSSSKKSVATVNSKGYFTAKNTGITTITVKYKGKKTTHKFQIMPSGSFESSDAVSAAKAQAAKLAKNFPSKISTKNGFSLLKKVKNYEASTTDDGSDGNLSYGGFLFIPTGTEENNAISYTESQQLAVPQAGRYWTLCAMLDSYAAKNDPTSTKSAKVMKIASVSATPHVITVKLKKKIDLAQILSVQINERHDDEFTGLNNTKKSKAQFQTDVCYVKDGELFIGTSTIQKGSDTIKIMPTKYIYDGKNSQFIATKLKKGKAYRLGNKNIWTKGKTVKVK